MYGQEVEVVEQTIAPSAAGYDLLLKVEYQGRTLWDCAGVPNPPHPSSNPACTVIPPGGLQAKLHLQVRGPLACCHKCMFQRKHATSARTLLAFCMQHLVSCRGCSDIVLLLYLPFIGESAFGLRHTASMWCLQTIYSDLQAIRADLPQEAVLQDPGHRLALV